MLLSKYLLLEGRVQGVGFRPFVYRMACKHQLTGWVRNCAGTVEIRVQGEAAAIRQFELDLIQDAPPLAKPEIISQHKENMDASLNQFSLLKSQFGALEHVHVPPDYFTCEACIQDLFNKADRRYRYPFINCTQCGPRYTLIKTLPYDRPNTTMAGFPLCEHCLAEYQQVEDRRFHAQPIACPVCGPHLYFKSGNDLVQNDSAAVLYACVAALKQGKIIAIKGIGGYHLMCDAGHDATVVRLRQRKSRPDKPLALLVPQSGPDGLAWVHELAECAVSDEHWLTQPMRPIVLLTKKIDAPISKWIAPDLAEVGIMLPYSPLHHLICQDFGQPLVATSANISGEPILTKNDDVEQRLSYVAEGFLHHNRSIQRPVDDPVYRMIQQQPHPLRMGRGVAPLELYLPFALKQPILATGGQMKNTIALAWDNRVVISPHIGDLNSVRSREVFEQVIDDLQALYGIEIQQVIQDAHPGYVRTRWAKVKPIFSVYHHHAHAAAISGEFQIMEPMMVFTWDGVGYGPDHMLWGGETLLGAPGNWQRIATFRPFTPLGGDKAAREPWRSAAALAWAGGLDWQSEACMDACLAKQAWKQQLNAPPTSAVGRLFDAASALVGLLECGSFEGQGPMWLESIIEPTDESIDLPYTCENACLQFDWAPLLPMLVDQSLSQGIRAAIFHNSLAQVILETAQYGCQKYGINKTGLSGGVFQNKYLTQRCHHLLQTAGFQVYFGQRIPANDAGLSYGQVIEAGARNGDWLK